MAKNTKQSNQKKSVLNKLGGLSKRSKFIVVVLIFAVLGGGYLTYKSFAATPNYGPEKITSLSSNNSQLIQKDDGCNYMTKPDPAKNNAIVKNLYCPPYKRWLMYPNTGSGYTSTWIKGSYKNCFTVKGVGKFQIGQLDLNTNLYRGYGIYPLDTRGVGAKYYEINDPNYKEYCSESIPIVSDGKIYFSLYDTGYMKGSQNQNPTVLTIGQSYKSWSPPAAAPNGK